MLKALISDLLLHSFLTDGHVDVKLEGSPEEPEMDQKSKEEEETQGHPEEDMDIVDSKEMENTGKSSDPRPRACKRL